MSKMTPEERQARRDKVASEALESVAKSEQFNFRMDADTIKRLYKIASEQRKPVGALVREWVLQQLDQEKQSPSLSELVQEIHALREQTMSCFESLSEKIVSCDIAPYTVSRTHANAAASGPLPQSAQISYPKCSTQSDIASEELSLALSKLKALRTGYYEIPEELIERLKKKLQPI